MKKLLLIGILVLTVCGSVGIAVPCAILPAPAGWSMIANPCDGGVTLVDVFLPATGVPPGTMLFKYTAGWGPSEFSAGSFWSPGTMSLSPGEGVFIYLPAATALGFEGVPLVGPQAIVLPAGLSICSPPAGLGLVGFPAVDGDIIYTFDNPTGTYDIYLYIFGAWFPAAPVIDVGESFWVEKAAPAVWVQ